MEENQQEPEVKVTPEPEIEATETAEPTELRAAIANGDALRMVGESRFAGYAFLWPKDPREKDLLDTYFTRSTDYGNYKDHADVLYQHGLDQSLDLERIGKAVRAELDDVGLWVEGELDKSKRYWKGVAKLVKEGKLFISPGSAGHLLRYGPDKQEVRSYPIVEYSLTPTPGQPRLQSVDFLRSIGLDVDDAGDGIVAKENGLEPVIASQKPEVRNAPNAKEPVQPTPLEKRMELTAEQMAEIAKLSADAMRSTLEADRKLASDKEAEALRAKDLEAKQAADYKAMVEKVTAEVRASLPAIQEQRPAYPGVPNFVPAKTLGEFSYLKAVRGIVLSHYGKTNAWSGSEKERDIMTGYADEMRSTLSENVGNLGAYLVPPQYVQEQFIPLLRTRAVVRAANPVVMQVNSNVAYIPSQTGGATAYWVGENATLTASNMTVGQVAVTIKKLAGLEYVSNELLADSNPSVDMLMRNDLAAVIAIAEDQAYLTGDGTQNSPVGMSNFTGITSMTCASDSGNGGLIQASDIFAMKLKMMQNNVPAENQAFFCSPRTWSEIAQLKDTQNRYLLETLTGGNIAQYPAYGTYPNGPETNYLGSVVGRLLGWPVYVTTNISETQTQGNQSLSSSLYLVRMSDVVIAERAGLELMATNVAGTSFASDQTWIRAIMRVGFTVRHAPAVVVMKGLT